MGISVIVTISREDEDLAWVTCKRTFSWRSDRCFMLIYIYFLSFPTPISYSWFWLSIDGCKLGQVMDIVTFSLEKRYTYPPPERIKFFFLNYFEFFCLFSLYTLKSIWLAGLLLLFRNELADEWWAINNSITYDIYTFLAHLLPSPVDPLPLRPPLEIKMQVCVAGSGSAPNIHKPTP